MLINLTQDAFDLAVLGRRMEIREHKDELSVVGQLSDWRTCRLRPYVYLAARYLEGKMEPEGMSQDYRIWRDKQTIQGQWQNGVWRDRQN